MAWLETSAQWQSLGQKSIIALTLSLHQPLHFLTFEAFWIHELELLNSAGRVKCSTAKCDTFMACIKDRLPGLGFVPYVRISGCLLLWTYLVYADTCTKTLINIYWSALPAWRAMPNNINDKHAEMSSHSLYAPLQRVMLLCRQVN